MNKMTQTVSNNSFFLNGLNVSKTTQSILDVFVMQGLLSASDGAKLKKKYRTNREIENVLLKNRIVSNDTVNKAYSILLKLPYISLSNFEIPSDVLLIIPKPLAEKFEVIPFGVKNGSLQLAVANPTELSVNFEKGLHKIIDDRHLGLDIYITSKSDFHSAIKQYDSSKNNDNLLSTGSYPTVYLRNQDIPAKFLGKLPFDFIKKYRVIVFYQKNDKAFALAAESPDDSALRKAIDSLGMANKISFQLFATSSADIDYAIDLYRQKLENKVQETVKVAAPQPKVEPTHQKAKKPDPDEIITLSSLFGSFMGNKSAERTEPVIKIDSFENNDDKETIISSDDAISGSNEVSDAESKLDRSSQSLDDKSVSEEKGSQEDKSVDQDSKPDTEISSPKVKNESEEELENEMKTDIDEVTAEALEKDPKTDENIEENEKNIGAFLSGDITNIDQLKEVLKGASAPKIVAAFINFALFERASDIHIEPEQKDLRVRYRVDGILRDVVRLPLSLHPPIISRIKILSKLKIDETRIPQDGRFDVAFKKREVDVRVSSLPTVHGEKVVLRILDKDQGILSLEDLGMVGRAFDLTIEAIEKPFGIILSTGPTGSGKSTTLYAIINRISKPSVNIVTLEDPVEYEIPGVNQCQVKPAIGFSFAEGLRSVLRQDPNVVMVGEIRDGETAGMATHAALTGHLVLSTLHTNDAPGALPRFINMGIEPFLITSSIDIIIGQRLVRRICPKCKEEMKVPEALIDEVKQELSAISDKNEKDRKRIPAQYKFYHGVGCNNCSQGYVGRIGIFEVLRMTEEIETLTVEKRPANDIRDAAIKDGMITMKQDGILKVLEGLTTIDEVFRTTSS